MLRRTVLALSVVAACTLAATPDAGAAQLVTPTAVSRATTLAWSSEFSDANGSAPDPTQWSAVTGGGGWGNGELETYTDSIGNAVVRDGKLALIARRETVTGPDGVTRDFTSARLQTAGKFTTLYGRAEARIKVPRGAGLWPSIWMLGDDIDSVGWPQCGEFNIMEHIGKFPRMLVGGFHGPGMTGSSGSTWYRNPTALAAAYHVYSMDWQPDTVSWAIDGRVYATKTRADLPPGAPWVFDHPFFLLLNVAVGGTWPGAPTASTVFPATMSVDWVRVYQDAPVPARGGVTHSR